MKCVYTDIHHQYSKALLPGTTSQKSACYSNDHVAWPWSWLEKKSRAVTRSWLKWSRWPWLGRYVCSPALLSSCSLSLSPALSLVLSLPLALSLSFSLSRARAFSRSLSCVLSLVPTLALSLPSLVLLLTLFLSFSLGHLPPTRVHLEPSLSLSLSLYIYIARTHALSFSLALSLSLSTSRPCSRARFFALFLSHTLSYTHSLSLAASLSSTCLLPLARSNSWDQWVMSHLTAPSCIWMSHVTFEWATSNGNEN